MRIDRVRRARAIVAPLLAACLAASCIPNLPALPGLSGRATQGGSMERRPIAAELAAATFDSAWTRVRDTYYDAAMRGIDWNGVRDELYPRAAGSRTYGELRGVLQEMVGRIGESHFGIIPVEAARAIEETSAAGGQGGDESGAAGDAGIELRIVDDELVVWRVAEDSPATESGIRPGYVLDSLDGRPVRAALRTLDALDAAARRDAELRLVLAMHAAMKGPVGGTLRIGFHDDAGTLNTADVPRRAVPGQAVQFGNLPELHADFSHDFVEHDGARIGVARFNVWMPVLGADFDRAMAELREADGIILDLRGNTGGVAGMVMRIAGHFVNETVPLGLLQLRGNEMRFVVNPQRVDDAGRAVEPFARPLALLTDGLSASTTEIFAAGMRNLDRATIFGERTAGQALPAVLNRLPSGDVLMHVIADLRAPDGTRLEGAGVEPDMVVPLHRAALLEGRDAALDAAAAWIATATTRRTAASHAVATAASAGGAATATTDLDANPDEPLPPADSVLGRYAEAIGGGALPDDAGVRAVGRFTASGNDASGSIIMVHAAGGRSFVRVSIPAYGDVLQGSDGRVGWEVTPVSGARLLRDRELDQVREDMDARALLRDAALFRSVETVGVETVDGERCYLLLLVWKSGRETHDCYGMESGLLIATIAPHVSPAGEVEVITRLGNYREFNGVRFATEIRQQLLGTEQIITLDAVEITVLDAGLFEPPALVRRLLPRR